MRDWRNDITIFYRGDFIYAKLKHNNGEPAALG